MPSTTQDLIAGYGSLTAADSARLDAASAAAGVVVGHLMETAGFQVARCVHGAASTAGAGRVVVVAGSGNNGGDGLVAARHLAAWGWMVSVFVIADPHRWKLAHLAEPLAALKVPVDVDEGGTSVLGALDAAPDAVVVDALLGTGLTAQPRPAHAAVIAAMAGRHIVSVDLPSGLDGTGGEPLGIAVRAQQTCTLAAMKSGLWTRQGRDHAGAIWVADIGIPAAAWAATGLHRPDLVTGGELLPVPS